MDGASNHSQGLAAAVALIATFFASVSEAAPRQHDGFYLQLTVGAGGRFAWASFVSPDLNGGNERISVSSSGPAVSSSLFAGGTIAPGIILAGGALLSLSWQSPWKGTIAGGEIHPRAGEEFFGPILLVGPLLDYYANPKRGVHYQAMAGYAALAHPATQGFGVPQGLGLMVGIGQDLWTSDEWSVGVLARAVYAHTVTNAQPKDEHENTLEPSLNVSFTYN